MDRVTLVWVGKGGSSTRVVSLPKAAVVGVVGGFFLFLALSAGSLLWARTASVELRGLEGTLHRLEAGRQESEEAGRALLLEKQRMEEELLEIRDLEVRIRRFLGLNEQSYDERRSHQGGMGSGDGEEGPFGGVDGELPGEDPFGGPFADTSRTLRSGLEEVVAHLEDRSAESRRIPLILPVDSDGLWVSSRYGWRGNPITGTGREFHNGVDIAGPWKAPIVAPADGEVAQVGQDRRLGIYVRLRHGPAVQTVFGHLAVAKVKAGARVQRGDVIGRMGNTGRSTGTHLHYSVRVDGAYVDPQDYIWDRPFKTLRL
ncbi:MAG: M23 family metallopeptidase [Deferrisomatales bacterium]|nr:M23 family metallopeptidase [Deferrisomatales bacterium]